MNLKGNRSNDAYATIRGFFYQVEHTLLEWLNLEDNEILFLEGLEDYDKVIESVEGKNKIDKTILNQIKHSEKSISLKNKTLTKYMINFIEHKENNPHKKIKFNFLTTSNIAKEKNNKEDKKGIEYWKDIFNSDCNKNKLDIILNVLDKNVIQELNIKNKGNIDYEKICYFIKDFNILTEQDGVDDLEEKIISVLKKNEFENPEIFYERAIYYLFKKLSQKGEKKISSEDIQSIINDTSSNKSIKLLLEIKKILSKRISMDMLKNKFQEAKTSWLQKRYVPLLHQEGIIEENLSQLLYQNKVEALNKFKNYIYEFQKREYYIDDYIELASDKKELIKLIEFGHKDEAITKLNELKKWLSDIYHIIDKLIVSIIKSKYEVVEIDFYNIDSIRNNIASTSVGNLSHNNLHQIIYYLNNFLDNLDKEIQKYRHFIKELYSNRKIILGKAGMGKTHGVAYFIESQLKKGKAGILIDAKSINNFNWKDIFIVYFGLNQTWSEEDIWIKLNNLAQKTKEPIIIAVDGLDEIDYKYRIELKKLISISGNISKKYSYIKFSFSGREYFFTKDEEYKFSYEEMVYLYNDDYKIVKMIDRYLKEFKININNALWIKSFLTKPITIKLFCDVYQGKVFKENDEVLLTVSDLLKAKINNLEEDIKNNNLEDFKDELPNFIWKIVLSITERFNSFERIDENNLISHVKNLYPNNYKIIFKYLTQNGLLNHFEEKSKDILELPKAYYIFVSKSIFDNILIYKELKIFNLKNIENSNHKYEYDFQELVAMKLFENENKLISEINLWNNNKRINKLRLDLFVLSLRNDKDILSKYEKQILELMGRSPDSLQFVVKNLIIPVSNKENHIFNAKFLHDFLMKFEIIGERDILWSLPDLNYDGTDPYDREINIKYKSINTYNPIKGLELYKSEKYWAKPLIFAWGLTSSDNNLRDEIKIKLTNWGKINPSEYLSLLKFVWVNNDNQMKEDLMVIAWGISHFIEGNILKNYANWGIENIFNKIEENKNIIIRYTAHKIVEKASTLNLISDENYKKTLPPFEINKEEILEIDDSDKEHYPIVRDFEWYVIHDAYAFVKNKEDKLIKGYDNHWFSTYSLVAYLKKQGWNKEYFWHGIDTIIKTQYRQETHGSKSKVMALEEKYIWMGISEINGWLRDYFKSYNFGEYGEKISYYESIRDRFNFLNPANYITTKTQVVNDNDYIHISNIVDRKFNNLDTFDWLKKDDDINFSDLLLKDKFVNLYIHNVSEPTSDKQVVFFSGAYFIKNDNLNKLKNNFNLIFNLIKSFKYGRNLEKEQLYSNFNSQVTPLEYISNFKFKENNKTIKIDDITLYKTIIKGHYYSSIEGDIEFIIPISDLLKKSTKIEKLKFLDNKNNITGYSKVRSFLEDYEEDVYIDKDVLLRYLKENNLSIVWIANLRKQPWRKTIGTTIERDRYFKNEDRTDQSFFIYFEGDGLFSKKISTNEFFDKYIMKITEIQVELLSILYENSIDYDDLEVDDTTELEFYNQILELENNRFITRKDKYPFKMNIDKVNKIAERLGMDKKLVDKEDSKEEFVLEITDFGKKFIDYYRDRGI